METARRSAERAARQSYGRLVAILAARSRDVAAAEDALADAFRIALETWPEDGVPEQPEAWLLVAARRRLGHAARHGKVTADAAATLDLIASRHADDHEDDSVTIPDERLALMFVAAHPAIDPGVQAPLMLQTVLGLDAERIAACFLTAPSTMGQRLVRAKQKIKQSRIPFEVPEPVEMPARLDAVLTAIYAAYGTGWEDALGADPKRKGLAEEAVWLARVLTSLMPAAPEAKGLLALMLYGEARRAARRDTDGRFVPLDRQDPALWDTAMIVEAERTLSDAARAATLGRFQIEASIQSVHVQRAFTGVTRWDALATLYDLLLRVAPTTGVRVARAAVVAEAAGPDAALAALDALDEGALAYQPYWAVRARVLALAGRATDAAAAYRRAAGMSEDAAVRDHLLGQAERMGAGSVHTGVSSSDRPRKRKADQPLQPKVVVVKRIDP
jgi:RNA polymerase sigma-70 factor (ECF subfamily)